MLVMGELSSGILVACVPTLGPIFFPDRLGPKRLARYRYRTSQQPLHRNLNNGAFLREPPPLGAGQDPYSSLDEESSELQAASTTSTTTAPSPKVAA